MIVVDASILVDGLLGSAVVAERLGELPVAAPHLIDLEVASALRRMARIGELTAEQALDRIEAHASMDVARYPHDPLLDRIWQLSHNLTAYDAAYVALADAMGTALLTADALLASAPGLPCEVELVG